jgi:hypothetical protein
MRIYSSVSSSASASASVSSSASSTDKKKNSLFDKLEPYYYETRHLNYIWTGGSSTTSASSTTGGSDLYQVENNKIYYIRQLKSKERTKTLLGAFPITIDHIEYIKEDECYQIPPKCKNEFLRHKVFKRTPTSLVEWVFVYEGDLLRENYFYVPMNHDINEVDIKADLLWGLHPPASQALTPALG